MDTWAVRIRRVVKEYYQSDEAYCLQEGHGRFELVQYVANVESDYRNLLSSVGRDTQVLPAVQPLARGGDQFMMVFTYRPTLSHRVMDAVYGSFASPSRGSGASTTSSARRRHQHHHVRDTDVPLPSPAPAHVVAAAAAPPPESHMAPPSLPTAAQTASVAVRAWWVPSIVHIVTLLLWALSIVILRWSAPDGGALPV